MNIAKNYEFIMEFFTAENIIEPIMKYYKDYNYVDYILNLPFKSGFKLYLKCIKNINEDIEKEAKNRIFQLWIAEGYKGKFDDYYKMQVKRSENETLGYNYREEEEKRILKDLESKKDVKFKRKELIM